MGKRISSVATIRWIQTDSQPDIKSCIAANYRQFSKNIEIEIIK